MITRQFGIPVTSPGAILRRERDLETPLGQETAEVLRSGGLVSDKIIIRLIEDWLRLHHQFSERAICDSSGVSLLRWSIGATQRRRFGRVANPAPRVPHQDRAAGVLLQKIVDLASNRRQPRSRSGLCGCLAINRRQERDMIPIKNAKEIDKMRQACRSASDILDRVSELVRPGITTKEVDQAAADFMSDAHVKSAFLGYRLGHRVFPGSICISLNDEVVHGIGSQRRIQYGDVVKLDIGIIEDGWVGDNATTDRKSTRLNSSH